MARPLKQIDAEQVFKLAQLGCTQEEIGEYFGCDHATISRRFKQEYDLGRASCKTSIRRWQVKKGRSGCTSMLIHLGKTYLGQTDRVDVTSNGQPVAYVDRVRNPRDKHIESANGNGQHTGNGVAS